MWKFVRRTAHQHSSVDRHSKVLRDLFSFRKTIRHGFPNKPTALAWDPELRIAALGTAMGGITVVGQPGVEFYGQHHSSSENSVLKLLFVPNEGKLISMCDDNSLHLWRISETAVEEVTSFIMKERVKKISSLYIAESKEHLLVGTEGGNIYTVDLKTFTLLEDIIYQDVAMQNVPEGKKINPGAVEAIAEQPGNPENILIGYRRGLMVLWNKKDSMAVQTYMNNQQLESFSWDTIGKKFLSSHNDGSYVVWSTETSEPVEEPITVYGPFPCKAITKIQWCKGADDNDEDLIVFGGGMPRASYSDRNTVTIQQGSNKHVVLDFTSKVIDFFVTYSVDSEACEALVILLDEELVAIDLTTTEWRPIQLPYLISLHASAVTYLTFVENIHEDVWKELIHCGEAQNKDVYSQLKWPINGGYVTEESFPPRFDILISGHEDGSVRFWDAGTPALSLLYTFKTNWFFSTDDEAFEDAAENHNDEEEEEWPPFRKVGCFDPFSDDPRLSIRKVVFCRLTGLLVVGGAAGQVVVCKIENSVDTEDPMKVVTINIIPEKSHPDQVPYQWKGAQRLPLKETKAEDNKIPLSTFPGYRPTHILQMLPPAAVTALTYQTKWCLVAIGTAHGLALFDYKANAASIQKCTLNTNDFSSLSEPPISRTKSFKKSLRESFRRIRKGRASMRQQDKPRSGTRTPTSSSPASPPGVDRKRAVNEIPSSSSPVIVSPLEARPIERAIEARPADDAMGSVVKCLYFFVTHVISASHSVPSLWAGTNNGTVYIFTFVIPGNSQRKKEKVTAQLAKEIQLKHRAPVVAMGIINMAAAKPIHLRNSDSDPHYVIICSEEQIKLFALPNLKPVGKLKLTAIEGARIRRAMMGFFKNGNLSEYCLQCLTNLGECIVLSIPELRRQMTAAVIKREDITGISTFTFTFSGEGLYLHSSSEIQRITLSSTRKTLPKCSLKLSNDQPQKTPESPETPEKQHSATIHNIITNGIPEEDEDETDEEHENEVDSPTPKIESNEDVKKPVSDEESQILFNHDVSAITLDSVKDHLAS